MEKEKRTRAAQMMMRVKMAQPKRKKLGERFLHQLGSRCEAHP